jgi:hypothetical protein
VAAPDAEDAAPRRFGRLHLWLATGATDGRAVAAKMRLAVVVEPEEALG